MSKVSAASAAQQRTPAIDPSHVADDVMPQPGETKKAVLHCISSVERIVNVSLNARGFYDASAEKDDPWINAKVHRLGDGDLRFEMWGDKEDTYRSVKYDGWGKFFVPAVLVPHLPEFFRLVLARIEEEQITQPGTSDHVNERRIEIAERCS